MNLERKTLLNARSERVKCVDFHPTEPWVLVGLYSGTVNIWDYNAGRNIKSIAAASSPVRCARFIARKNWVIVGSDDFVIRVFNMSTGDRLASFEAHNDYIRCLAVHPSRSLILSCSDDTSIKLWDWERDWKCTAVFEGHIHYVMAVAFNPRDSNTFASASLDRTVKIWSLSGGGKPNFSLEGHAKGLNAVAYFPGSGDKPYLATGADDRTVRIWDYQSRSCVRVLEGHQMNVSSLGWGGAGLPLLFTASEDGTLRIWNALSLRCESSIKVGMDRIWALAVRGNEVVLGCDEGMTVLRLGRSEPVAGMHGNKVVWVKNSTVLTASAELSEQDGSCSLPDKELGSSEVAMINQVTVSPSGRYISVVGNEGDYVIYSSLALRNKAFGKALEVAWNSDADQYATRDASGKVTLHAGQAFNDTLSITINGVDRIFGGKLLGIYSASSAILSFHDWATGDLVRSIEVSVEKLAWDAQGKLLAIYGADSNVYILSYNGFDSNEPCGDEGHESAFDILDQVAVNSLKNLSWLPSGVLIITSGSKVLFWSGSTSGSLPFAIDDSLYLLGCIESGGHFGFLVFMERETNRLEAKPFDLRLIQFQIAISTSGNDAQVKGLAQELGMDCKSQAIQYFEKHENYSEALKLASDEPDVIFRLALKSKQLDIAYDLLEKSTSLKATAVHWKALGKAALAHWKVGLAERCFASAEDWPSLLLLYSLSGNSSGLAVLAAKASQSDNWDGSFTAAWMSGNRVQCMSLLAQRGTLNEAAIMGKAYGVEGWEKHVSAWKQATKDETIADPENSPHLFPQPPLRHKRSNSFDKERVTTFDKDSLSHDKERSVFSMNSANSELDALSVEVHTTGTGSLKGDDIDMDDSSTMAAGHTSEPIPEDEDFHHNSINNDEQPHYEQQDYYYDDNYSNNEEEKETIDNTEEDATVEEADDIVIDDDEDPWKNV